MQAEGKGLEERTAQFATRGVNDCEAALAATSRIEQSLG